MNKCILVTGGAGYIGSHTVTELLNSGFDVVIIDNFSNSEPKTLERIKKITGKDFYFYRENVNNTEVLKRIFEKHKFEAVIHFSGSKYTDESFEKSLEYYENNVGGTVNLLKVMNSFCCKKLIFSSTAALYSKNYKPPYNEECKTFPVSPYGTSKGMVEKILKDLTVSDKAWGVVSLRYFNAAGAHESGLLREYSKGKTSNVMPILVKAAANNSEIFHIFGNDYDTKDGTCIRDYVHVTDLARGHIKAIEYLSINAGYNIFNLGTGKGTSVLELVKTYEKACGNKIHYVIDKRRKGDVSISFADVEKAKNVLGWSAEKSLLDICRDTINSYFMHERRNRLFN